MTERRPPARRSGAPPAKRVARPAAASSRPGTRPTTPVRKAKRPPKPGSDRSALWRWRRSLYVVGLMAIVTTGGASAVVLNIELPPSDPLLQTSFVCTAEVTEACGPDNAVATFSAEEDRINVHLEEVPEVMVQAVLATEDRDYYAHGGIDPTGIARALYRDVRGSQARQGGSTITQQYVKNAYLTSERSLVRKVKEAVLAVKLERELDKDEILERYLNTIYFGRGAYGVGAATRAYFNKDVEGIGLLEASYLAGLIRSPGSADALAHPEEATRRRETVLSAMEQEGYITPEQEAEIAATPIGTGVRPPRQRAGLGEVKGAEVGTEYFVEAVRQQIAIEYGEDTLYGGGLRIYTTLDPTMQRAAYEAVTSNLDQPGDPAGSLVAVDEHGYIRAMVGGTDFANNKVNLALGRSVTFDGTVVPGGGSGRGAGSSFKPFVLAAAVKQGISLNSKFDAPAELTFPGVQGAVEGEDWKVRNYGGTEQGVLDLADATRVSSNTAYAQLMLKVGAGNVVDVAHQLGVSAELPAVPALVLGSGDVSPVDMAVGYSTFANRGIHNGPTMIARVEQVDEDGQVTVIDQARPTGNRVMAEEEADLVTYCLRGVVQDGTGTKAAIGRASAGKTGTTQDNKDAWFVGYVPQLTAAVWVGYPDADANGDVPTMNADSAAARNHGVSGVTGGSLPAEIWHDFMVQAVDGMERESFTVPGDFPGEVLNEQLEQTTTTAPTSSTSSTSSTTTTTVPPSTEPPTTTSSTTTTTTEPTTTTSPPVVN